MSVHVLEEMGPHLSNPSPHILRFLFYYEMPEEGRSPIILFFCHLNIFHVCNQISAEINFIFPPFTSIYEMLQEEATFKKKHKPTGDMHFLHVSHKRAS